MTDDDEYDPNCDDCQELAAENRMLTKKNAQMKAVIDAAKAIRSNYKHINDVIDIYKKSGNNSAIEYLSDFEAFTKAIDALDAAK
jgi:hypothetical protein